MQNERLNNARQEQNTLQEEQLKIQSDIQKVKELKERQETLYMKEISFGKSINMLKKEIKTAEMELNSKIEKLEEQKVYFFYIRIYIFILFIHYNTF